MWSSFFNHRVTKYIFFGVLTTLVNFIVFWLCYDKLKWEVTISNILSIISAILFAYVVNANFVFKSKVKTWQNKLKELQLFISARLITMGIEIVGVWLLVQLNTIPIAAKIVTNIIVLVLNYIFSKWIFHKHI